MRLTPDDEARYPERLRELSDPPILHTSGTLERAGRAIAIVGSRTPQWASLELAYEAAYAFARAGYVVVSGGAVGIDATAHTAALDAGGRTWVVLPNAEGVPDYPPKNAALFERVKASPGSALVWPFDVAAPITRYSFLARNRVLVTLASLVVAIQIKPSSGSQNATRWAQDLGRPLFVPPGGPNDFEHHGAKLILVAGGATPLYTTEQLLATEGLTFDRDEQARSNEAYCSAYFGLEARPKAKRDHAPCRLGKARRPSTPSSRSKDASLPLPLAVPSTRTPRSDGPASGPIHEQKRRGRNRRPEASPGRPLEGDESLVFSAVSTEPRHLDEIVSRTHLGVGAARTALLTLSLEDVVVEGPDGFYRRANDG